MSTVLMKVLVSQCQDTERALDMLCWPSCSWPELDRVEALSLFLGELVLKSSGFNGFKTKEGFKSKVQSVIWDQCVPLLKMISSENSTQSGKRKEMLHATCAILMVCVKECQTETLDKIASLVFPALSESKETQADTQQLDTDVAIEVLAVLLSGASSSSDLTKTSLSCTLRSVKELSETWVSKIIVRVWFTCLNSASKEMQAEILCYIWGDLLEWFEQEGTELATERLLLCFTALSDFLFSLEQKGPEMSHTFFKVVQAGLVHKDNVARKRALYLLNRCLSLAEARHADVHICETEDFFFNWTAEHKLVLREFWEAYTLVLETLEEYQIHVIRPVLSRIDMLVKPTSADTQGGGLIHPSWLLCVYQRMFHSENKAVIKEGVTHLLGLQTLQHPSFAIAFSQFVVGPFMDVLAETSLYHRSAEQAIGECPELGLKLQRFLAMFFSSLPEDRQGSVLLQMLKHLSSQRWYSIPLLFLSQAMSCLSPRPLLKADGLQILREVLGCSIIHHHILLRGATQCFLLHTVLHLADVSGVSLNEIFALLAHFRAEESLCPGTPIWEKLCDWFLANEGHFLPASTSTSDTPKKVSVHSYQSLKAFLTTPSSADQANQLPVVGEVEVLARTLLLSADLDWKRKEKQSSEDMTLEQLFCPLLDILHRLNTSVYLPLCKTDKSLQLMLRLLVLLDKNREIGGKMAVALTQLLFDVSEPVQEYILRRLNGDLLEFSDIGRAHLYLSLLRVLIRTYNNVPGYRCNLQKNYVSRLTTNCLRFLSEPSDENPSISGQVQKAVSMATLALLCELAEQCVFDFQSEAMRSLCSLTAYFCPSSSSSSMPLFFNQTLLKPSSTMDISGCTYGDPLLRDWNRVVAYFLRDQWTCISFLQKFAEIPRATEAFQAAVEALSLLPSDLVLPVLDFMCAALPQVLHKEALCLQAVSVSWKLVHALSTNAHDFWPALRAFVRLAFHHSLLELQGDQNHKITACIQKVTHELIELSQAKFGVFNVLIEHCCNTWLPSDPNNQTDAAFESALNHLDILIEACIHGPLYRKDQRLLQEVQTYVKQLGDELAADVVINSWSRDDQFPRLCILAFLSRLEPSNSLHQRLMEKLVQWLIKKDKEISRSKVRYYNNSMQHRVKNRVWQTLLLLLPKLKPEFVVENVFGLVCEAGFGNNQPSVKYLIEWALILILHQNPSQIQHLWACFDVDQEKTKTSICTFLSVLVHLGILLPKLQDKEVQWQKALEVILLWCFSHNFTVRLYAFLALKRVWGLEGARHLAANEQCSSASLKGLATVVEACLHQAEVLQSTGNAVKNWSRIQEHFFFSAFHPINDYSVETIFQTFPVLSELAEDECIPMWKFEKLVDFQHSSFVPLKNAGRELSELKPSDWVQQDRGELEQEERWADVQKKIAPWSLNVQEVEPHLVTQQRVARLGKPTTALLVVGSLIDKPTNLGGLCRTCEIFGASALVLGSLHHVGDKQFQALSVSSELWLPLMEVKPMELAGFLQLKQREGYSIIGVEQTANSQSLQSYRFPEKTLLLLGNEREGIPADLLQLLDVCVEIPQQGVTRSLNVHVSAALLVWEYTRQHLSTDQSL